MHVKIPQEFNIPAVFGFVCNKGNHLLCRWERKSFSEERSDKIKTP